ncbi:MULTISPECIES: hypothetical protein [Zoogloea]|jgi:hypothetical protein|uniref:Uncharacterized protein n=1 Tax=Zoogloea oleivorans TaxID=1552750 RepID=A0A6C2D035_9RHOO|nr:MULTISPECIES: hypothetical protein [Zoogloea]MDD2667743.1 hypothetical protein [Zoogloea sp.]MDY0036423.1 hypothetical protein [Zoogloea oleivorans]TYC59770.1 hypothetical protein ETQ85_09440 [Zoogloea oleivorans]
MSPKKPSPLSSRELLAKIGIDESSPETLLFDDEPLDSPLDDLATALRARFASLNCRQAFQAGDVVGWKVGLKNRRWPTYGKPAIVVEVLDSPVFDTEKDSGDAYFREPLDLALGVFIEEGPHRGDFVVWHFDSRRLQAWTSEEN